MPTENNEYTSEERELFAEINRMKETVSDLIITTQKKLDAFDEEKRKLYPRVDFAQISDKLKDLQSHIFIIKAKGGESYTSSEALEELKNYNKSVANFYENMESILETRQEALTEAAAAKARLTIVKEVMTKYFKVIPSLENKFLNRDEVQKIETNLVRSSRKINDNIFGDCFEELSQIKQLQRSIVKFEEISAKLPEEVKYLQDEQQEAKKRVSIAHQTFEAGILELEKSHGKNLDIHSEFRLYREEFEGIIRKVDTALNGAYVENIEPELHISVKKVEKLLQDAQAKCEQIRSNTPTNTVESNITVDTKKPVAQEPPSAVPTACETFKKPKLQRTDNDFIAEINKATAINDSQIKQGLDYADKVIKNLEDNNATISPNLKEELINNLKMQKQVYLYTANVLNKAGKSNHCFNQRELLKAFKANIKEHLSTKQIRDTVLPQSSFIQEMKRGVFGSQSSIEGVEKAKIELNALNEKYQQVTSAQVNETRTLRL